MSAISKRNFDLEKNAVSWYYTVETVDVDEYYQKQVSKLPWVPFVQSLASAIYDPKIFDVMKPTMAARFASIDGWIRMMWQGSEKMGTGSNRGLCFDRQRL